MNEEFRLPFLSRDRPLIKPTYIEMMRQIVCPHFQIISLTTLIIVINFLAFIIPRIIYPAPNYSQFLILPSELNKGMLDAQLIKSNKLYFFETITAMFLHLSYLHYIGNTFIMFFIIYQLEYCWKLSPLVGIICGFMAHCVAIIIGEYRYLGFSGALCSYLGIYLAALIVNCPYIQQRYQNSFCFIIFFAVLLCFFMIGTGKSAIIHLFGFLFGMIFGAAYYPRSIGNIIPLNFSTVLKIITIVLCIALVIVSLIV